MSTSTPGTPTTGSSANARGHISFGSPPPGRAPLVDFELSAIDGADGLHTLRSTEVPELRLFLVEPDRYVPDYRPRIDSGSLETLDVASADDERIALVATLHGGAPTDNLMTPVLITRSAGRALQVVLDDDAWSMRAPLKAA